MARTAHCVVFLLLLASPLTAQSVFYGGATLAADAGGRGPIDLGTFAAAGGFVGWRFVENWAVEFHVDQGFGENPGRTFEGLLYAQDGGGPADRERRGIFGQSTWGYRAREAFSLLFVWQPPHTGRVGAAVTMGISRRRFQTHHVIRITGVGPDVTYPPDHPILQGLDETWDTVGGGGAGGVMFPIRVARQLTLAPELRVTLGLITDESTYKQFYSGVRVMWGR
jgi:hypothetical protein